MLNHNRIVAWCLDVSLA